LAGLLPLLARSRSGVLRADALEVRRAPHDRLELTVVEPNAVGFAHVDRDLAPASKSHPLTADRTGSFPSCSSPFAHLGSLRRVQGNFLTRGCTESRRVRLGAASARHDAYDRGVKRGSSLPPDIEQRIATLGKELEAS